MQDFVLAVGQWPVSPEKELNLERAAAFLREASRRGASLCLLPEMFQTPYDLEAMRRGAEEESGPTLTRVRSLARELRLHVIAGSFCERRGGFHHNSSFVVGPDGEILGVHRKIHLFDVSLPDVRVRESSLFAPGEIPLVVETPFCRLGVAVCYDVRFPAVFRYFESRRVEVVAVPAAFSRTTGAAHWHCLFRARAVESQVFLAAACPAPDEKASYVAHGHSLIIDPWGTVLAEAGEGAEVLVETLSAARLEQIRRELPLLEHRRPSIYRGWLEDSVDGR